MNNICDVFKTISSLNASFNHLKQICQFFVFDGRLLREKNGFVCSKKERLSLEGLTVIEKVSSVFFLIAYIFFPDFMCYFF